MHVFIVLFIVLWWIEGVWNFKHSSVSHNKSPIYSAASCNNYYPTIVIATGSPEQFQRELECQRPQLLPLTGGSNEC